MEIINWALSAFGIDNVPSVDVMKSVDDYLQSLCGIHTVRHEGALGHIYYMNDLAGIIRQVSHYFMSSNSLTMRLGNGKSACAETYSALPRRQWATT